MRVKFSLITFVTRVTKQISRWRKELFYFGMFLGGMFFFYQLVMGASTFYQRTIFLHSSMYLLMSLVMLTMTYGLQMLAWTKIMHKMNCDIGLLDSFRGYVVSFLPRYIPGTVWGYLGRNEWLKQKFDISYFASTLGSILEVGLIVLTGLTLVTAYYFFAFIHVYWFFLVLFVSVVVWLTWSAINITLKIFFTRYRRANLTYLPNINFQAWSSLYLLYILLWSSYGITLFFLLNAFGVDNHGGVIDAVFIFTSAWLVGFIAIIVPSGLGVREFTMATLLVTIMMLPNDVATAIAVISRFLTYFVEVSWIIIGYIFIRE